MGKDDQFLNNKRKFLELFLEFSHRGFQQLCTLVKMHATDNCPFDSVRYAVCRSVVNCLESITKKV